MHWSVVMLHSKLFLKHTTQFCCVFPLAMFHASKVPAWQLTITCLPSCSVLVPDYWLVMWVVMYGAHMTTRTIPCTTTRGSSGGKLNTSLRAYLQWSPVITATVTAMRMKRLTDGPWPSITYAGASADNQYWTLNQVLGCDLMTRATYLPFPCLNSASISSNVLFFVSGTFLYVKIQKMARNALNGRNV
jgi:hypothetical protein